MEMVVAATLILGFLLVSLFIIPRFTNPSQFKGEANNSNTKNISKIPNPERKSRGTATGGNIEQVACYDNRVVYQVTLNGDQTIQTTLTSHRGAVGNWINHMESMHRRRLHNLVVGLDIEWLPNDKYHNNPVSVLQLCVGHHCLVFQIQHAYGIPESLANFLSNQDYTFAGVGIDNDAQKLYEDYGLRTHNTVDLRNLASTRWNQPELRNLGLVALAKMGLDLVYEKPKNITLSNWSQPNLSGAQIRYAAIDAFLSFEIGRVLNAAHFQV